MTGTQALKGSKARSVIPAALCEHIVNICEEEYRECSVCHEPMQTGYCIDDGEEYFCSDDCLHSCYSAKEYEELCEQDRGYWTDWF